MKIKIILSVLLFFMMQGPALFAQENDLIDTNHSKTGVENIVEALDPKLNTLEELKSAENPDLEKINALEAEVADLKQSFVEVIAGVNLSSDTKEISDKNFSWSNELRDLLSPILSQLKQITSQPRQIEALRGEVTQFQQELAKIDKIIEALGKLEKEGTENSVRELSSELDTNWLETRKDVVAKLSIVEQKLKNRTSQKKSIGQSVSDIFDIFFKSKGRNFFIAFMAALIFFCITSFCIKRFSKFSKIAKIQKKAFVDKIMKVSGLVINFIFVPLVFIATLFFLSDWMLLIVSLLLFIGIVWSTKQLLPKYWEQGVLILDSGPVRSKERVVYNGVPYQVKKINFYSLLHNPELEGGIIRLPINDLWNMRSRMAAPLEPWFPTKKNDWIMVNDQYAQVQTQTPSFVILKKNGGSTVNVPTEEFINSDITNLSVGFRVNQEFGLSYGLQKNFTKQIPSTFKDRITEMLYEAGYEASINKINVSVASAGTSSLNLAIIVDFKGTVADKFQVLKRLINQFAIEICNENDFEIPFDQLTVHIPEKIIN